MRVFRGSAFSVQGFPDEIGIQRFKGLDVQRLKGFSTYLFKSHHVCAGFMPKPWWVELLNAEHRTLKTPIDCNTQS